MILRIISVLLLLGLTWEINFDRTIVAVHFPTYKVLLSLGDCKNRTLYSEQQIWATVKLNRILDIFYSSNDSDYLVSSVEIRLVLNNTEFMAKAYNDVGSHEFRAHILFPIHCSTTFYRLDIYTCNPVKNKRPLDNDDYEYPSEEDTRNIERISKLQFYTKKMPTKQLL